jgi:hypothetical protein
VDPNDSSLDGGRTVSIPCATDCFIETGTYRGDMTAAMARHFGEVHSIELGEDLFERAVQRFRGQPHVHIHHGDSASVLARVLADCSDPTLFWLDAHYSAGITARADKDTPVIEELSHIFRHPVKTHVILIDDARCFDGQGGYPSLPDLAEIVARDAPQLSMSVQADIIRLVPR